MAKKVGDTVSEDFALKGGVTGETFTFTSAVKGGGLTWSGPTITEKGGGEYTLSYVGNAAGVWSVDIIGNTTGQMFTHTETFRTTSTRSFTRRAVGQVIQSTHVNELQQAIEDLSY